MWRYIWEYVYVEERVSEAPPAVVRRICGYVGLYVWWRERESGSRYIRYSDNIGYPRYGERYDIGDNQYSSNNLSYCPINRFLESISNLTLEWQLRGNVIIRKSQRVIQSGDCRPRWRSSSRLPLLAPTRDSSLRIPTLLGITNTTLCRRCP